MTKIFYRFSVSAVLALALSACGGSSTTGTTGGGGNNQQTNTFATTIPDTPIPNHALNSWNLSDTSNIKFAKLPQNDITDFSQIVYNGHPRLYFRDTDKAHLKANLTADNYWDFYIASDLKRQYPAGTSAAAGAAKLASESGINTDMLLFAAYIEENAAYKAMAIAWAMDMANPNRVLEDNSGDIILRARIQNLAKIYDWLYADLTDTQKETIRTALKRNMDQLLTFGYLSDAAKENYIQSHSRWARAVIAEGTLALYGDFDTNFTKAYADNLLNISRKKFLEYMDTERYIAIDGGWHLGYAYAYFNANYTFNYLVWTTATTETFLDDWMGELSYWFIYGLRGDNSYSRVGDAFSTNNMSLGVLANAYNAKFKNDPYAQGYLDKNAKTDGIWDSDRFIAFLLKNNQLTAKSPDTLPTSRLFKNVGTVVARDNWGENSTHFYFKSSPFYNAGHHHRDENAFTLHYRVPLALDSGVLEAEEGTTHYKNYFSRTLAHNAITVYNPNQKMYYFTDFNRADSLASKLLINDGGQVFKVNESLSKTDILPGAANRLGGITAYQFNSGAYTYAVGDATKAYDPATVSLAKREVVFVTDSGRDHPTTVVLDRVEATDGNFQKRYLLHVDTDVKPNINDTSGIMSSTTKGIDLHDNPIASRLTNMTLYPQNAQLALVSGFTSYGDTSADLTPTAAETTAAQNNPRTRIGNWRLEVSPVTGKKYDLLLNVLFVDNDTKPAITANDARLIGTADSSAIGVQLINRVIVFPTAKNAVNSITYKTAVSGTFVHTVATGYTQGTVVTYSVNNQVKGEKAVGTGGCVDFTINAATTDTITISKK